jgi:SAM-dependent methyltransferase
MCFQALRTKRSEIDGYLADIERYDRLALKYSLRRLEEASILEIGYGARPIRLLLLASLNFDVCGIDLDRPTLRIFSPATYLDIWRRNGFRRMLKSLVRGLLFDWHERNELKRALAERGVSLRIDETIFHVGNAADHQFPPQSIDFVYSEDVFEHIPPNDIETICQNIQRALTPTGIAVISPCIFTGICGGHLTEWYPGALQKNMRRDSEPWEHLRKRRFTADCYLNGLSLGEYQQLFAKFFSILDIINESPGLGENFLTDEIRAELSGFDLKELTSDKWTFVLGAI